MDEPPNSYLGHFAGNPSDVVLVSAYNYQDAILECDRIRQPDSGSFEGLHDPLVLRLQAVFEMGQDWEGEPIEVLGFNPHPDGAIVLAGRDLARILNRVENKTSSITDDVLRSIGDVCTKCNFIHHPSLECKIFLEPTDSFVTYLGLSDDDPRQVFVVVGPDDPDTLLNLAEAAGRDPQLLIPVVPGAIFGLQVAESGTILSDPELTCDTEDEGWLRPLEKLLRKQQLPPRGKKS